MYKLTSFRLSARVVVNSTATSNTALLRSRRLMIVDEDGYSEVRTSFCSVQLNNNIPFTNLKKKKRQKRAVIRLPVVYEINAIPSYMLIELLAHIL